MICVLLADDLRLVGGSVEPELDVPGLIAQLQWPWADLPRAVLGAVAVQRLPARQRQQQVLAPRDGLQQVLADQALGSVAPPLGHRHVGQRLADEARQLAGPPDHRVSLGHYGVG